MHNLSSFITSYIIIVVVYFIISQHSEILDKLAAAETEAAELKNKNDDMEYNLEIATTKVDKFDRHLADAYQKIKTFEEGAITVAGGGEGVSKKKVRH